MLICIRSDWKHDNVESNAYFPGGPDERFQSNSSMERIIGASPFMAGLRGSIRIGTEAVENVGGTCTDRERGREKFVVGAGRKGLFVNSTSRGDMSSKPGAGGTKS